MSTTAITALAFDYGLRTIGVAVGQSITNTAQPLTSLRAKDGIPIWDEIQQLLSQWKPDVVVVGLPLNMDGSHSEMCTRANKFARRIHGRFGVKIELADERLSSFEAKGDIIKTTGSRNFKAENVDSLAAKLILETWFNA
ncbi:MAG: Holliday junction resolvase RuvX [Spongiibacteraceae bacterium]|nr:Holliday junction resolvase RuvX [Spongiibacteraceae bacterium]